MRDRSQKRWATPHVLTMTLALAITMALNGCGAAPPAAQPTAQVVERHYYYYNATPEAQQAPPAQPAPAAAAPVLQQTPATAARQTPAPAPAENQAKVILATLATLLESDVNSFYEMCMQPPAGDFTRRDGNIYHCWQAEDDPPYNLAVRSEVSSITIASFATSMSEFGNIGRGMYELLGDPDDITGNEATWERSGVYVRLIADKEAQATMVVVSRKGQQL